MLKKARVFLLAAIFLFILVALPVSKTAPLKSSVYSALKFPLFFSGTLAQTAVDLFYFKKNADENRSLRKALPKSEISHFYSEELFQENTRLTKLLNMKQTIPPHVRRMVFARVISRPPSLWTQTFLIDKGTRQGVRENMIVLSEVSVVGKIVEAAPYASKVLLITDPNSKIGVLIQRTRQQGVLFGTTHGECHIKYLTVDAEIKKGDIVETAGFSGFFPKALMVGNVERAWKEPGQIYQVAQIKPLADLEHIEEVAVVE